VSKPKILHAMINTIWKTVLQCNKRWSWL